MSEGPLIISLPPPQIWDAIEEYVQAALLSYYRSSDAVKKDKQLQNWITGMRTNATDGGGQVNGVPDKVESVDDLVQAAVSLTPIAYCGGFQLISGAFSADCLVHHFPGHSAALCGQLWSVGVLCFYPESPSCTHSADARGRLPGSTSGVF